MTREEAIKIIRKMLACTDLTVRANLNADMVSACNLAIKALEQKSVLEKIRAEIERERSFQRAIDEYDIATGLRKALEIFDKYKAESEDT